LIGQGWTEDTTVTENFETEPSLPAWTDEPDA
jgi:hypothetical protein